MEPLHSFFELRVSACTRGQALLESFEFHENPHLWILKRHGEQSIDKRLDPRFWRIGTHREIAVIERRRRGQDASGPGIERALIDENEIVGIENAGGIRKTSCESLGRLAFTAHVVAVLANHYIVVENANVAQRIHT